MDERAFLYFERDVFSRVLQKTTFSRRLSRKQPMAPIKIPPNMRVLHPLFGRPAIRKYRRNN
jgi:hypothetical protein